MMKRSAEKGRTLRLARAASCMLGTVLCIGSWTLAAETPYDPFDHQSRKIYEAFNATPEVSLAAISGDRNLVSYYALRQYPGSPPSIPHPVDPAFSGKETDCLSCHAKGGFAPTLGKFTPVTPHPEYTLCFQCHAQITSRELFRATTWQSISPPKLGRSSLPGSPPPSPHTPQLRENCIACHTGPGAVTEIRVEHASRGNCRQCHVSAVKTEAFSAFRRP